MEVMVVVVKKATGFQNYRKLESSNIRATRARKREKEEREGEIEGRERMYDFRLLVVQCNQDKSLDTNRVIHSLSPQCFYPSSSPSPPRSLLYLHLSHCPPFHPFFFFVLLQQFDPHSLLEV